MVETEGTRREDSSIGDFRNDLPSRKTPLGRIGHPRGHCTGRSVPCFRRRRLDYGRNAVCRRRASLVILEHEIETYLYENIPITKAMGIHVEHASAHKVVLFAPFANNINHKKTVFGGSLHAVATLACWTLIYVKLKQANLKHCQIVITSSEVAYQAPVDADFRAVCAIPEEAVWQRFIKTLLF